MIDAPDFDNASLVRYRQAKMTAADGTDTVYSNSNDEFPTKFKVNGNPHYTKGVPVFKNFVVEEVIFGDDLVGTLKLPNTLQFVGHEAIRYCHNIKQLTFFETNLSKDNSLVDLPNSRDTRISDFQ